MTSIDNSAGDNSAGFFTKARQLLDAMSYSYGDYEMDKERWVMSAIADLNKRLAKLETTEADDVNVDIRKAV